MMMCVDVFVCHLCSCSTNSTDVISPEKLRDAEPFTAHRETGMTCQESRMSAMLYTCTEFCKTIKHDCAEYTITIGNKLKTSTPCIYKQSHSLSLRASGLDSGYPDPATPPDSGEYLPIPGVAFSSHLFRSFSFFLSRSSDHL
jgi:hypothetical protein